MRDSIQIREELDNSRLIPPYSITGGGYQFLYGKLMFLIAETLVEILAKLERIESKN